MIRDRGGVGGVIKEERECDPVGIGREEWFLTPGRKRTGINLVKSLRVFRGNGIEIIEIYRDYGRGRLITNGVRGRPIIVIATIIWSAYGTDFPTSHYNAGEKKSITGK